MMTIGLILVDIQNDYFSGGRMELVGMEEAGSKAKDLLSLFRAKQWPTFHIQHIATGERATFFIPDTEGVETHDHVKPLPGDVVIHKHYPNSFRKTRLLEALKEAGIEQVVICGAMSHMCVDATTRAAADFGFDCTVIHDACATRDLEFGGKTIAAQEVHGSFMAALGAAYAKVMGLDEFLSNIEEAVQRNS
jgi:nicotinamidase-related amidase